MRIGSPKWSIDVATGWSVTDDAECFTLLASEGAAFQLSSMHKSSGEITDEELLEFANAPPGLGSPKPVHCGDFSGYCMSQ